VSGAEVLAGRSRPATEERVLHQERTGDGVLLVTLDVPAEKVNTLGPRTMAEFAGLLDEVEADPTLRGVVLRSGKPDSFVAGADIEEFTRIRSSEEGEALSRSAHALLDRLERCRVPVVAAIHGTCLGGGTEMSLACRYRVASDSAKTTIGLPEVLLGLVPGAGGSQRLPRLVGLAASLDLILTGRTLAAPKALRFGLVDEVCPAPILTEVARRAAVGLAEGRLAPRRRGISLGERLGAPLVFSRARTSVLEKTGGNYPAPLEAIEVVRRGTATTLAEGLKLEARAFGRLSVGEVSRNLVSVFFATREIKKDAGYPEGTPVAEVGKLGVLGAGLMGAGIAGAAAGAGVTVRMRDTSHEALRRGLSHMSGVWGERVRRGRLTRLEAGHLMDLVSPSLDLTGFGRADLVIEAVFEDLDLKRRVLAETEAATRDECVFASNTSSIPIGAIAEGSARPAQVIGMHFFSPVHRMPLLEVVVTPRTAPATIATAVGFGRRIGKHVIVVRDGPGFYTTRTLAALMNEATWLLDEGVAVEDVDRAMTGFGFPVGPVTLLDEVGIDVAAKVAKVMHSHFGERMAPPPSMEKVLADGRRGRKNGRGFYTYDGGKKRVDETVYALLARGATRLPAAAEDVRERLVFAFLNEAVLCLQEGILRSPRDGDVGAIFGLGFPPFRGGPFRYLDHVGARTALETLEKRHGRHGARFTPASMLEEAAREGRRFHVDRD
jgi:3-hydroxyacyl-CoA dehydrogenase/enoyl-CoA hydratase/3-hydroxybutyryl-CoA epimerase